MRFVGTEIFDPCREFVGGPLAATSFFRCELLNTTIGGSKTSQHVLGFAVDMDCDVYGGRSNAELFHFIKDNLEFDQLIWEFGTPTNPAWIHASKVPLNNRGQVLVAYRDTRGKTRYVPYDPS